MTIGAMKLGKNYQVRDEAFGTDPVIMQLYKEPETENTYAITVFRGRSITIVGDSPEDVCKRFSDNYPKCVVSVADSYNSDCIKKQIQSVIDYAVENDLGLSVAGIIEEVLKENADKIRLRNQ